MPSSWDGRVFSSAVIGAAALITAAMSSAQADGPPVEKLALCQSCHGALGISTTSSIPSLAGEPEAFIQYQLVFFRSGSRKSDIMGPIAAALSDDEVRTFSGYYAALPPPMPPATPDNAPALTADGAKLAAEQHCAACHMPGYTGTQATARLAAQREDYLKQSLTDFKVGKRIGGGVAAMPEIAFSLSDGEIVALAHFLSRHP
jgi:cytochrome c553